MKVLMLNTFDAVGGAARAAARLQKGVRGRGIESSLLVQFKTGTAKDVICNQNPLRQLARRLKLFLGLLAVLRTPHKPENNFSTGLLPGNVPQEIARYHPDIIHLHWLCASFLSVGTIGKIGRLGKPLVWTLHDSWPFTGGCHVPFECQKYQQVCGACPVLGTTSERDLSWRVWQRKAKAWKSLNLTVVAPSRWLADCARSSSLFRDVRVEVIPNGLDTETFRPKDMQSARKLLSLPQDKKIILFGAVRGASDPNKGFHLLMSSLQALGKDSSDKIALVFSSFDNTEIPDLGMPVVFLGQIHDDEILAAIYSAADVFVVPSIQEAFCQTASEALACGTPVVAFAATGLLDVVEHKGCGYLAKPYDCDDLARGIRWVLDDVGRHARLSTRARQKVVAEFNIANVAERYVTMYRELLALQQKL
jgi:glycosyltransferase involved in cell wall biosynthesis